MKKKIFKLLLIIMREINCFLRNIVFQTHKIQFQIEWGGILPLPEWFDHYLDTYYQWPYKFYPLLYERGCFNLLAVKDNANILELCSGDGYNTKHFYSFRASKITALDYDQEALNYSNRYNSAPNISYLHCDIRKKLPDGKFDNVIWDATIEHFTEEEIVLIIKNIKDKLNETGVLSGYTIVDKEGKKPLGFHKYIFRSKEDLFRFLNPYFKRVLVFETFYPHRHNLYFHASDGVIPFSDDWEYQVKTEVC